MKAIAFAYHDVGCAGIEALLRNDFEIPFVLTHSDDPAENVWFDSVAELAASRGIPVFAPDDPNHPLWVEQVRQAAPDVIFSFYYRKLLRKSLLEIPEHGCFNLHGSLLPRYRGRAPVNWALVNGERETGVTLHVMTPKVDAGDIVAQERVAIDEDDTARTVFSKLTAATAVLLDDVLPKLKSGSIQRVPQDATKATTFGGRGPEDGEIDWSADSRQVRNLVRAVTRPYPGAFSHISGKKCLVWQVTEEPGAGKRPGALLATDPPVVACGSGAVRLDFAQTENGVYMSGSQLAGELGLTAGMTFGPSPSVLELASRKTEVLILGANGFIGNALSERLLESGRYNVHAMDLRSDYLTSLQGRDGFNLEEGDISIHREWIEYHVKKCDVVIPLVAIATPIEYTRNPLRVFELDFEENLRIVRYCVKYGKRLIFPSTSEVYGMSEDESFDEDNSKLVLGPIRMQRWIYSCSKQLMDRVIWAYGAKEGLPFTLFRPFNWIGPKLDRLSSARIGSSRAITQLILNLVEGSPIQLIDGGMQKRCFTDVADGIECLFRIIENQGGACDGKIVNIGNPDGEYSIKELAEMLVAKFEAHPLRHHFPPFAGYHTIESGRYYGAGYQDVQHRKPSIRNAQKLVGWSPTISLDESVENTLDFFLRDAVTKTMVHQS